MEPRQTHITVMKRLLALTALAVLLPTAALAQESRATSPSVPELRMQENPVSDPEPRRSFVPGHAGENGTWVRPYYKEGGPPPLGPDGQPRGYRPGGYDSTGHWQPGGPN
jgi:hypothetical protein